MKPFSDANRLKRFRIFKLFQPHSAACCPEDSSGKKQHFPFISGEGEGNLCQVQQVSEGQRETPGMRWACCEDLLQNKMVFRTRSRGLPPRKPRDTRRSCRADVGICAV